jgi:hypothetical protein
MSDGKPIAERQAGERRYGGWGYGIGIGKGNR